MWTLCIPPASAVNGPSKVTFELPAAWEAMMYVTVKKKILKGSIFDNW
jgi:hypothetical protein